MKSRAPGLAVDLCAPSRINRQLDELIEVVTEQMRTAAMAIGAEQLRERRLRQWASSRPVAAPPWLALLRTADRVGVSQYCEED